VLNHAAVVPNGTMTASAAHGKGCVHCEGSSSFLKKRKYVEPACAQGFAGVSNLETFSFLSAGFP
jgi:hypothetical protein